MTATARNCTYPGCRNGHLAKGYCNWHYKQHRDGVELRPQVDWRQMPCRGPQCDRMATSNHGCCRDHRVQQRTKGVLVPLVCHQVGHPCSYPQCDQATTRNGLYCKPHGDLSTTLMRNYGIDVLERCRIAERQGHACWICKATPGVPYDDGLFVDHCHDTGRVRGLLCNPCNIMLGMARDNVATLSRAIDYLQQAATGDQPVQGALGDVIGV